ncbi:MAG: type II toxin-antitoxin system mRNA interferase toxin, RelE/StbE family [Methyloprofundus sp.]|nr:type II toxin-antitoxin system mRNA interferase toxin, RelE/StbE family [Methyloprofundus sp.]
MGFYSIVWKNSAKKELKRLPKPVIKKILFYVEQLQNNIQPVGSKKIVGLNHTYRLRTGDYRIVYSVQNDTLIIEIIRVGHRKEIYRKIT